MVAALKRHWPEYLMEASGLAVFMMSASIFGTLIGHPSSPVRAALPNPLAQRALMGLAMGLTAAGLIYSPWGKQSGAHLNPSVTLAFLRSGRVERPDAAFYILAQFAGGVAGVVLAVLLLGSLLAAPEVDYVVTRPGPLGAGPAFAAEVLISFVLMGVVLRISNVRRFNRYTGVFAGALVAAYITFEAPLSGMSMNPARTFASAVPAGLWSSIWIYFLAPPLGMLAAAEAYGRWYGARRGVLCAKLHHENVKRCIFRCSYGRGESHGS